MEATAQRDFVSLVKGCAKRGISRSSAYRLADAGLLDTGHVGKLRVVYLDSLLTLPQRMAANKAGKKDDDTSGEG